MPYFLQFYLPPPLSIILFRIFQGQTKQRRKNSQLVPFQLENRSHGRTNNLSPHLPSSLGQEPACQRKERKGCTRKKNIKKNQISKTRKKTEEKKVNPLGNQFCSASLQRLVGRGVTKEQKNGGRHVIGRPCFLVRKIGSLPCYPWNGTADPLLPSITGGLKKDFGDFAYPLLHLSCPLFPFRLMVLLFDVTYVGISVQAFEPLAF